MTVIQCRLCAAHVTETFVDLGMSPLAGNYLPADRLDSAETFYPLHVRVCANCLLVQLPAYVPPERFLARPACSPSYPDPAQADRYARDMLSTLDLGPESLVIEVASSEGRLLRHFATRGVRVLGVEPAAEAARVARAGGIPTEVCFLGATTGGALAERFGRADLVLANNVYPDVPDLLGFTAGLAALTKPTGLVMLEFPHLLRLIQHHRYDTIHHEHYQYLSLLTAARALATAGLGVVDVTELPARGGSLRVYARPGAVAGEPSGNVRSVLRAEAETGLDRLDGHRGFAEAVFRIKRDLLEFLLVARARGQRVVGYGAPGDGDTLLNQCGIRTDLLAYTVDGSPYKQGRFLPGSRIPIHPPSRLAVDRPEFILVLPWELRTELTDRLRYVREWGGRLVFPIPALEILD